jgi:hypothetical protein
MKRDLAVPAGMSPIKSSFLSCEKDCETILRKLFVENQPYSQDLIRLLVINTPDCLDNKTSPTIKEKIKEMDLYKLREEGYIRFEPKIKFGEHEDVKSYIIIGFDNFATNATNPEYRDCTVSFDILCHTDCWDIGNFRLRPLKIAGYIDGILNRARLSGIGQFNFVGCVELVLDETLAGYTLVYNAVHGSDDIIPNGN